MLRCSRCGQFKDESEFWKKRRNKRGYSYACKQCQNEHRRKTRRKPARTDKKQAKIKAFSVFSTELCSDFKEPHKTLCLTTIHRLAKQFNDDGKLKIDMVHGYVRYVFLNREIMNKILEQVEEIKNSIRVFYSGKTNN